MSEEKFGLIIESKVEGPLLMEQPDMSRATVERRMRELAGARDIIRVCMVRLVYETGNRSLLSPEVPATEEVKF